MNWYPLRVISGKEGKVKENLMFELDYQNLVDEVSAVSYTHLTLPTIYSV